MDRIRELFSQDRKIERRIEKVIDYRAVDDARLAAEIEEYEVTPSVERGMDRLLERIQDAVVGGDVTEIGAWVSGYYGSGKSSFTKYLGFALDPTRTIHGAPFVDMLAARIPSQTVRTRLKTVANQVSAAVFMLDLGTDQLAESASVSVTNVLYWNVLKELGFSKEKKVADLELRLEGEGRLEAFEVAYAKRYPDKEPWREIHNDPSLAVTRASTLLKEFYPDDYADPAVFRQLRYQDSEDVGELAKRVIALIRQHRKCKNVIFFVDEVGQYVAPRQELILNLDGLVRSFKEVGQGSVWFVATAQQTLTEISEKASLNSAELIRLKDRFPITVELEATDIRDITARRLLPKSNLGAQHLKAEFKARGAALEMHTHLTGWPGGSAQLDADSFASLYPFLPARFNLVLALIHALARRTGTGLRSAIRLVQDLLVDTSHTLPPGTVPLADRPLGQLATIDDIYDTLRRDLYKDHAQAVDGVERIAKHPDFKDDALAVRAAKAVAALQPLENYPRTAENIAALLYSELGAPGDTAAVTAALQRLVDRREFGLVELRADGMTQGSGYLFLSNEVGPIQKKRDDYVPPHKELNDARVEAIRRLFDPVPQAQVDGTKTVQAGVRLGKIGIVGDSEDILFRLEEVEPGGLDARLKVLTGESRTRDDYRNCVFWLFERPATVEDLLLDVCRSTFIQGENARSKEKEAALPADVGRFLRSELRRAERAKDTVKGAYQQAMVKGVFVFDGRQRAVGAEGTTVSSGASSYLDEVARDVFSQFAKVKKNVAAEVAGRFLQLTNLKDIPRDRDPLEFLQTKGGRPSINMGHPALVEALRAFRDLVKEAGSGRVKGDVLLEFFNAPPYGWSKDTTRYVFAALLQAGEVELHSGDGVLRTPGPKAAEAVKNTQSFSRIGVAPRGEPVPVAALDRASRRLEVMFGVEVLPLEDQISRVVRTQFPSVLERIGSLPDRLRLLKLQGETRARAFQQTCADLLKEDAGGAASILGSVESTIPVEEKWSSGVVKTLESGGEEDIGKAQTMVRRVRELAELFPSAQALCEEPSVATITEILGSDSFFERMPDLRGAQRALEDATRVLYRFERARLDSALEEAEKRLQSRASWPRLDSTERAELAAILLGLRLAEEAHDPVGALQKVLTRRLGLADAEERVARGADERAAAADAANTSMAARRASAEAQPAGPNDEERVLPVVEAVAIADLLPETDFVTPADVEAWLDGVRTRLLERVQLGPIRLKERF